MSDNPVLQAIKKLDEKIDSYASGLNALADGMERQTKLIEDIHKACTATRPPSPLLEKMDKLIGAVQESNESLFGLIEAVEVSPENLRRVVREELDRKKDEVE